MRTIWMAAENKSVMAFNSRNEPLRKKKLERAIDGRRTDRASIAAPQEFQYLVRAEWLIRETENGQDETPYRSQFRAARVQNALRNFESRGTAALVDCYLEGLRHKPVSRRQLLQNLAVAKKRTPRPGSRISSFLKEAELRIC